MLPSGIIRTGLRAGEIRLSFRGNGLRGWKAHPGASPAVL
jgi:hypothetical protein